MDFPNRDTLRSVPRIFGVTGLTAVLTMLGGGSVWGQFNIAPGGPAPSRFIEPPRSIMQVINEAERSIAADRFSEAVVGLGDMLARDVVADVDADLAGQDFFLDAGEGGRSVGRSMMREAERILGELPVAGQELYELRFGAKAKQLLDIATAARDRSQLREISRRYLHTDAGLDATMLLGQMNLSEGKAVGAMAILRRLAAIPKARKRFGDPLMVSLAQAEALAGRKESAVEHLIIASKNGNVALSVDAGPGRPEDDPTAWLERQFGRLAIQPDSGDQSLWIANGGPTSRGAGRGNLPLSRVRWDVPTTTSRPQQRSLEQFEEEGGAEVPPPSWQPIKVGDQLLMRTTERLMAVDFETGIRIWEFPWSNGPKNKDTEFMEVEQFGNADEARELLIQRVWNDLPYGRMTSDGKRVFLLDKLGEVEMAQINQFGMPMIRGRRPADTSSNSLVALDLSTEGKLLWTRGKEAIEPAENNLAEAFFLGPPLPVEGLLYQLAELAGDIYLLALDPESGRELWRQQILGNDGGRVSTDPLRRIGGAMPAYSDGILVCPTGAGAVVAIDLTSRSLLWGYNFSADDTNISFLQNRRNFRAAPRQSDMLDRWLDGTPTVCDGIVLITPVERDRIYALDLVTGTEPWAPLLRNDFRYLAGCRDGQFFLVASNRMQAYSLASGKPTWPTAAILPSGELISGTGVFGDGVYYLPTSTGNIVAVDLATGKIVQRRSVGYGLGNLLADGNSIVSQTATDLSVAFAEAPLRNIVDQRLQTDADDQWAMVRKGELLLESGERDQAVEWLLRAREGAPQDEEVRMLLVDALLTAIRNGRRPDPETTALLDQLIEMAPQRVELLRLKSLAALDEQQPIQAVENLIELSQIVLREEQVRRGGKPQFFASGPDLQIALDPWIAAQLRRAIQGAEATDSERIREIVAEYITPRVADTSPIRRRALTEFGSSLAADPLRIGMWSTAIDEGELGRAERLGLDAIILADQLADDGQWNKKQWQARLAGLYLNAGFDRDALRYARAAQGSADESANESAVSNADPDTAPEDPDSPVDESSTPPLRPDQIGGPVIEDEIVWLLERRSAPHNWPGGVTMSARDEQARPNQRGGKMATIDIVGYRGEHMAQWQPKLDSGAVLLRDPRGFDHRIDLQNTQNANEMVQVAIDGGLMFFLTSDEIIAVDLLALQTTAIDSILWRRKWWNQAGNKSARSRSESVFFDDNRRNYIFSVEKDGRMTSGVMRLGTVVGSRMFLLQGGDVVAIDVVTNDEMWRSSGHENDAFLVANDRAVGVVSAASGVQVLSYHDGQPLGKNLWEPSERLIAAAGPHVLTLRNEPFDGGEGVQRVVRLRSPIDDSEVLKIAVGGGKPESDTRARLVDGRFMVLLTQEGRLVVWDMLEGRSITDRQVEFEGRLTGIRVLRNRDSLVLCLERREDRDMNQMAQNQTQVLAGPEHVDTDGPLIAVGLGDGEIRWRHQLEGPWGISLDQPADSPLIILTRTRTTFEGTSKGDKSMDLLAVDTRDGQTAVRVDGMSVVSNLTAINTTTQVRTDQNMVDVTVDRYGFSFQFADADQDQEPLVYDADAIRKMHDEYNANPQAQGIRSIMVPPGN
jgi:outer membrane protein assembly factor BamB